VFIEPLGIFLVELLQCFRELGLALGVEGLAHIEGVEPAEVQQHVEFDPV